MDEQFVRNRITELRIAKGKSEREMSLDLGHSCSYINSITSGRISPSLKELLYICEYLHITPDNFFKPDEDLSLVKRKAISQLMDLDDKEVTLLSDLMEYMKISQNKNES